MILVIAVFAGLLAGLLRAWLSKRRYDVPQIRHIWLVLIAFLVAGAFVATGLRNVGKGGEQKVMKKKPFSTDDDDMDDRDGEPPGPRPAGGPQPLPGPRAHPQAGGPQAQSLPPGRGPQPAGGPFADGGADYYEPPPPEDSY